MQVRPRGPAATKKTANKKLKTKIIFPDFIQLQLLRVYVCVAKC